MKSLAAVVLVLLPGCIVLVGDETPDSGMVVTIDGPAWVRDRLTDGTCTASCTLPVQRRDDGSALVRFGSPGPITVDECTPDADGECTITGDALHVHAGADPNAVGLFFVDAALSGIAVTPDGDLVLGTEVGLRRVGPDGTERWRTTAAPGGAPLVGPSGVIVTATPVTAYHADGTIAWQSAMSASALALLPDGSPVALVQGTLYALSVTDGSVRWMQAGFADGARLAVDATGMVAVGVGTTIHRLAGATGAPLTPDWTVAAPFGALAFDPAGVLVAPAETPSPGHDGVLSVSYQLYAPTTGASAGPTSEAYGAHGFAATAHGVLEWTQEWGTYSSYIFEDGAHVQVLDLAATTRWRIAKPLHGNAGPHEMVPVDAPVVRRGACDRTGTHCAIVGVHVGAPDEASHWVETFAF